MQLRAYPLTSAPEDQQLYVRRPVDDRVDAALESELNVLLRTQRGAGATSLLNRVDGASEDVVAVNASTATAPEQLLHAVAARARVPRQILTQLSEAFGRLDPLAAPSALRELRSALKAEERRIIVLVDGPLDPQVSHTLFGRLRDEVFGLPATWVVAAHDERAGEYLAPPADVFFETVYEIESLDDDGARDVLARRGVLEEIPERLVDAILDAQDGTPRSVISLARAQLQQAPGDAEATMRAFAEATRDLPRTASMLLAELQGRGPVSTTDHDLLDRLAVSDRQLRRLLAELELAGLVERVPAGRGGPGRPPAMYMATELGRAGGLSPEWE